MTDLLLQTALSNACLSLVLAAVALIVERTAKRPVLAHLLWVLVLVKLVTPPVVTIPVVTLPGPPDGAVVALEGQSQQGPSVTAGGSSTGAYLSVAALSSTLEHGKAGLSLIWLLGSALVLAWSLVRIYRFDRLLKLESEAAPTEVQAVAAGLASRLGMKAAPTVYTTSAHLSPMVWWVGGKVRIVIPAALLGEMERQQFQWILAHELAHVRRRDYLVRWLEWLACVCFWWNPLVWWARHHLRANEELCCDALVVSGLKPRPHTYANSLLAAVEYLVCSSLRPPAVASEVNSGGFFERRFKMIVSGPPKQRTSRWLQASVLLCAVVVLPLGLVYGEDVSDRAEAYIQEVAAKLQTEVEAGNMTAAEAEAKLADIEEGIAVRSKYEAVASELRAAVDAGEIPEEEARARWEAFEQQAAARERYEAVASELRAAVEAGEITEEEAKAKHREIREQVFARGGKRSDSHDIWCTAMDEYRTTMAEYRMAMTEWRMAMAERRGDGIATHEAVGLKLGAAVAAGEITEEEARAKWEEYEEQAAAKEKYRAVSRRIRAAVAAGEITEEEAKAKWEEYEEQAVAREKCEVVAPELRAAVAAGELTEEEAKAKWEEYAEQAAAKDKHKAVGSRIRAAVQAGELTEEEARAKWEEYKRQKAAEEK
jgi:beta-lactamase regulating signal transducer with metallopeptidase domain/polyhydroxyalkanoate synthesis regulator phasin